MPAPTPPLPADAHVLVVGAGGIGCPAAWALARAGVGRITLVDPDQVETSNLPRQILYREEDVGADKAVVAAARLRGVPEGSASDIRGVPARMDHDTADALLAGVSVLVDATDGAQTKDWLNQLAVRRRVPLIHAAALRSEARLLTVPAGGRACLACLFGRLTDELGSCADLGVWNGVVGTIGFLAADAALRLMGDPAAVRSGYAVLDFEGGRALTLGASASPSCPVCADASGALEPYPETAACTGPGAEEAPAAHALDLSSERCPLNLLRARKALATLEAGAVLEIVLGHEGAETVPDGVRALGHEVLLTEVHGQGLRLRVRASGRAGAPQLQDDDLRRYARQIVLPEFGERGQLRLGSARVRLVGTGVARETAQIYLRAAGVGSVVLDPDASRPGAPRDANQGPTQGVPGDVDDSWFTAWVGGRRVPATLRARTPEVIALARTGTGVRAQIGWDDAREEDAAGPALQGAYGALLADAVQRHIVLDDAPLHSLRLPLP